MRIGCVAVWVAFGAGSMAVAQEHPAVTAQPARHELSVSYEGGRLSLGAENARLLSVLEELARKTAVKITVADEVEDADVSMDFSGPLDLGLRALLLNFDAFFNYGGVRDEPSSLRAVWVYPKGAALTFRPATLESCTASRELESLSADNDPAVRRKAYEGMLSRPDSRNRELVIQAIQGLREKDDNLRQQVFSAALSKGLSIPQDVLSDMARTDASEPIRWMALDALSQQAAARQAAEAALTDASPAIRQKAEEILTALAAESQRKEGRTRPPDQDQ